MRSHSSTPLAPSILSAPLAVRHARQAISKGLRTVGRSKPNVTIVECAPRDARSAFQRFISIDDKIQLINRLVKAGLSKIDCVAFTHPRLVPEDADAEQVIRQLEKKSGAAYMGMVPSEIGCRRAILTDIDEIIVAVAASDLLNKTVLGLSSKEVLNKTLPTISKTVAPSGKVLRGYVLAAFGCPYSGKVPFERLSDIVCRLAFMGIKVISLVDSTGMAIPKQVGDTVSKLIQLKLDVDFAVHFHDSRGTALANCLAAHEAGITIFDTAIGGLSAAPFGTPQLDIGSWNVPTEDLVHVFEQMGVKTGINLNALLEAVDFAEKLAGHPLPGHILRAGLSSELIPPPEPPRLKAESTQTTR